MFGERKLEPMTANSRKIRDIMSTDRFFVGVPFYLLFKSLAINTLSVREVKRAKKHGE